MSPELESRIRAIMGAVNARTGFTHLNLESAVQVLCDGYSGQVGAEEIQAEDDSSLCESVNCLERLIRAVNAATDANHADLTAGIQTLCGGYRAQTPLYSFGVTSDIHLQYETGISDFRRALAYFENQGIPFSCVCGDLTWAASMVNADRFTTAWKGGLQDYKDLLDGRTNVYAIGGNHECYTATYDTAAGTWSSVDTGLDVEAFRANTGCDPFYTISSAPDDAAGHNVYCGALPDTDVFIMLSIKKATAPNLFFTADDGEDEFAWLENVLELNKQKRCFLFFHEHDNLDQTADPFGAYPLGLSEDTAQGKAFLDLMRRYGNVIWFHGHTHNTFEADYPPVATQDIRGYRSVNVPSTQGPRKFIPETKDFTGSGTESEGFIVDVYENYIVLKALDFSSVNADGTGEATVMEVYALDTPHEAAAVEDAVASITATFTQGDTVILDTDPLDALKPMLAVHGNWTSGAVTTVEDYTLSGTLSAGVSTITVTYGTFTTTFQVTVTAAPKYANLVLASTDTSGNIYNGGTGYKQNYRLGSSGTESAYTGAIISGFIPIADLSDVIRITGHDGTAAMVSGYVRAVLYNEGSSYAKVGHYDLQSARAGVELGTNANGTHEIKLVMSSHTGVSDPSAATHFRVTLGVCSDPAAFIVTRNQEIC